MKETITLRQGKPKKEPKPKPPEPPLPQGPPKPLKPLPCQGPVKPEPRYPG